MPEEKDDSMDITYDPGSLPSLLPIYYKYIFPYGPYYKWLSYNFLPTGETTSFTHREFSFTLQNDIYVRYQSFSNQAEMEKEIQRINPYKIDIGAIYSHYPKDHNKYHSGAFKALTKELVFDIDMTDYDDVRKCCQGADICPKCWTLMKIAIKIINRALKDDFGFKHVLWVYSGRRGVHCWVCDEKARKLSAHARSAIVEYLSLIQGGNVEKRANMKEPVHPYIRHCLQTVNKYWDTYALVDQEILSSQEDSEKVLQLIPDENIRASLQKLFKEKDLEPAQKWKKIRSECSSNYEMDPKRNRKLRYTAPEIMLEYCFPRLDVNVSKGVNHLLKSPFCVHPKTGRVCVPIDADAVDQFDPFTVPTVSELCAEVEQIQVQDTNTSEPAKDEDEKVQTSKRKPTNLFKKTRLNEYMMVFDTFLNTIKASSKKPKEENMDF